MPIPIPNTDELETEYMRRCMADDYMLGEYDDNGQRFAVCQTTWEQAQDEGTQETLLNRGVEKD